jgi:DNA-binding protein Fis
LERALNFEPELADRLRDYVSALLKAGSRDIYDQVMLKTETRVIEEAISFCKGNQTRASALLGITRTTIRSRLRKAAQLNPPTKSTPFDELMALVRSKRRTQFVGQTSIANDMAACIEMLMATRAIQLSQAADLLIDAIAATEASVEERASKTSALSVAVLHLMRKSSCTPGDEGRG